MIIALMGNDGSGKTTIAKKLVTIFRDLGFEVVYKHEYRYEILRFLIRMVGLGKIESERRKMIVERKESWKYYIWPFLVWFDVYFSYIRFKLSKRKAIVIFDRYLYDHYISFKFLGNLTKMSEWLYRHSPRPCVSFVLWIEPRTAYKRKRTTHAYNIKFYEKQTKHYIELAKNLGIRTMHTEKSVTQTINEVLGKLPQDKITLILTRGVQNRVLLSVIEKHRLSVNSLTVVETLRKRNRRLEKTLMFIRDFFDENNIVRYSIVKTLCSNTWIGNDIDVLVSREDFDRTVCRLKESIHQVAIEQNSMENGKADINIVSCLPIDLHSYIGWRNVVFITSEEILEKDVFVRRKDDLNFVVEKINSIIIALTHVFEKGFVTLDEYIFIEENFDDLFLQTRFPYLHSLLIDYLSWLRKTPIERRSNPYPLLIPITIIAKCYSKLLSQWKGKSVRADLFWKMKAFIRDISFMIFWRIRFATRNKLPFQVRLNAP